MKTKLLTFLIVIASIAKQSHAQNIITTVAGTGTAGYTGDGGQATSAELNWPNAVAFDTAGNMYIVDTNNQRIRKVNTAGIISTFAGNGACCGFSGDGGQATAAELYNPSGIAFDAAGNFYIADMANNRIRKVNTAGVISTVAGYTASGGYSGDGGAATAAN
jgi:sugar lactone lactonase YvrE